jgi:hypothetical protein
LIETGIAGLTASDPQERRIQGDGVYSAHRGWMAADFMARDKRFWTSRNIPGLLRARGFRVYARILCAGRRDREWPLADSKSIGGRLVPGHHGNRYFAVDFAGTRRAGAKRSRSAEIYRRAEEYFVNKQYAQAAQLYEQLLAHSPNDAEIYNNLGLTLFYLGRPDDALRWLNEGAAKDAGHQRIWLTLGYVNSQLGNTEQARVALTNAMQVGGNTSIRESAEKMLAELP